jgi:hypothetical protein
MILLIEPFKKILHCHWLIFSTDSQRELFVNTALAQNKELNRKATPLMFLTLPPRTGN